MKVAPVLLSASLAGNVALAVAIAFHARPPAVASTAVAYAARSTTVTAKPGAVADAGRRADLGNRWSELNRGDAKRLVLRLRGAGFPPSVVQAVVKAVISERYNLRQAELDSAAGTPYWQQPGPRDPRTIRELMRVNFDREREIIAALGADGVMTSTDEISRAASETFDLEVPAEKRAAIMMLVYDAIERQINARSFDRPALPEDATTYRKIEDDLQKAIAQLMTPAEYQEFKLHQGPGASRIRAAVESGMFVPTEQEYRTIARVYQSAYLAGDPESAAPAVREELDAQVKAQLELELGADRYAEWDTANTREAQKIGQLVRGLDLPPQTARDAVALQKEFDGRLHAIETDSTLSTDTQRAKLATLLTDAQTKFTALLGPRGYYGYRTGPGRWISTLEKRTVTP